MYLRMEIKSRRARGEISIFKAQISPNLLSRNALARLNLGETFGDALIDGVNIILLDALLLLGRQLFNSRLFFFDFRHNELLLSI